MRAFIQSTLLLLQSTLVVPQCNVESGIAYRGKLLQNLPTASPPECQENCVVHAECQFWTFRKLSLRCKLYENISLKRNSLAGTTSGPKRCKNSVTIEKVVPNNTKANIISNEMEDEVQRNKGEDDGIRIRPKNTTKEDGSRVQLAPATTKPTPKPAVEPKPTWGEKPTPKEPSNKTVIVEESRAAPITPEETKKPKEVVRTSKKTDFNPETNRPKEERVKEEEEEEEEEEKDSTRFQEMGSTSSPPNSNNGDDGNSKKLALSGEDIFLESGEKETSTTEADASTDTNVPDATSASASEEEKEEEAEEEDEEEEEEKRKDGVLVQNITTITPTKSQNPQKCSNYLLYLSVFNGSNCGKAHKESGKNCVSTGHVTDENAGAVCYSERGFMNSGEECFAKCAPGYKKKSNQQAEAGADNGRFTCIDGRVEGAIECVVDPEAHHAALNLRANTDDNSFASGSFSLRVGLSALIVTALA